MKIVFLLILIQLSIYMPLNAWEIIMSGQDTKPFWGPGFTPNMQIPFTVSLLKYVIDNRQFLSWGFLGT